MTNMTGTMQNKITPCPKINGIPKDKLV